MTNEKTIQLGRFKATYNESLRIKLIEDHSIDIETELFNILKEENEKLIEDSDGQSNSKT